MKDEYIELKKLIEKSNNIVFFGGAGVSTKSGLRDFRGNGGFYTDETVGMSPSELLSYRCFISRPELFFDYYRNNLIPNGIKPNPAHYALAKLESIGKLSAIVTQNIDGLHQLAGSKTVFEVHGTVYGNHCIKCGRKYSITRVTDTEGVPYCDVCGGLIHPDIVLYGEGLDTDTWINAQNAIYGADLLIVAGTSLSVEPAASLVGVYQGEKRVIINKTPTAWDEFADVVIRDPVGAVLDELINDLEL